MKILIIGNQNQVKEFELKFEGHEITVVDIATVDDEDIESHDVVFDFLLDEAPDNLELYQEIEGLPVFVNAPKISLAEQTYISGGVRCLLFGFNGLPTFLNREILEVSLLDRNTLTKLEEVCHELGTEHIVVDDRVGMATPRVICMIINEAFYTVQEGTASKKDIDLGMKLGTNYPYGPFEWCDLIGVNHVYELLEAVYEDTKDERYKICPMLKKAYLTNSDND
ncbi:MAG: 3-hydroxyacyl-CoA dehydrogenase family protein [Cyclobacteriaceae bacterium]|nr:3-hydroxyacyl-CoA dehydrogenase family protein [Cyclobacteriaceae bacterium]